MPYAGQGINEASPTKFLSIAQGSENGLYDRDVGDGILDTSLSEGTQFAIANNPDENLLIL